jgi:hypothetical protein
MTAAEPPQGAHITAGHGLDLSETIRMACRFSEAEASHHATITVDVVGMAAFSVPFLAFMPAAGLLLHPVSPARG